LLILSFSGQGENSLTLKSLEVLEHHKDVEAFEKVIISPSFDVDKEFDNVAEKMKTADVIIWAVSPFHMNIPSHMYRFFEKCREEKMMLHNINTFFQTNMRVCDTFLSTALERQIRTISTVFVQGLSFATPDIINRKMALYNIATPDLPPKKVLRIKNTEPKFYEGEGLRTAVQWYKILKKLAVAEIHPLSLTSRKTVLFVDMNKQNQPHSSFVSIGVRNLEAYYQKAGCNVEKLAQRDYNIKPCDGCKICYASKECKIKDDYLAYEERISEADIIIYYGACTGGFTSSVSKTCIDRGVKNGLMPKNGVLPENMHKYQAVGYVLDTDPESYAIFKDYAFAMASFSFQHFLGILANIPNQSQDDLTTMKYYSLLVTEEEMLPQRNFYSEKIGKHFADLSRNIPTVIPEEAKYYRKSGAYDPISVDPNARTVMPDTYRIGQQMRQIPYNKAIEALDKMNQNK
jgi:multimeric flavodoxin WrbA